VEFCSVTKTFRKPKSERGTVAISELSVKIEQGEFVTILGPSGCGKTTLLRLIAGLETVSAGSVLVDGKPVEGIPAGVGLVLQKYPCFPWRTVRENVGFGLELSNRDNRGGCVEELLQLVGLEGFDDELPGALSGGMQQRVAVARTLVTEPCLLLLDEPFGALDSSTRRTMQELITNYWASKRATVVFVTHDADEALLVSDRIIIMSPRPGRVRDVLPVHFQRPRLPELRGVKDFVALERSIGMLMEDATITASQVHKGTE
jgi:NitT/TauT family transport system ATP-binding protein